MDLSHLISVRSFPHAWQVLSQSSGVVLLRASVHMYNWSHQLLSICVCQVLIPYFIHSYPHEHPCFFTCVNLFSVVSFCTWASLFKTTQPLFATLLSSSYSIGMNSLPPPLTEHIFSSWHVDYIQQVLKMAAIKLLLKPSLDLANFLKPSFHFKYSSK